MLDFFTIFSKGGIVLWYFQGTVGEFTNPVNELIKTVVLQVVSLVVVICIILTCVLHSSFSSVNIIVILFFIT